MWVSLIDLQTKRKKKHLQAFSAEWAAIQDPIRTLTHRFVPQSTLVTAKQAGLARCHSAPLPKTHHTLLDRCAAQIPQQPFKTEKSKAQSALPITKYWHCIKQVLSWLISCQKAHKTGPKHSQKYLPCSFITN